MLASAVVGNLVRWGNGREGDVGVVADRSADGHQVTVRFDSGETHNFVVPSATLDRLIFPDGHHLSVRNDGRTGVVVGQLQNQGLTIYRLSFPDGSVKTVPEDSVRPARITDPLTLLRQGELVSPFSMNLRLAGTRLLFAHQFDDLSSLSNSRVEIGEEPNRRVVVVPKAVV